MSIAIIDGLEVNYEKRGAGSPLLLFAPGGFDATMEKWISASAWRDINALDALARSWLFRDFDARCLDVIVAAESNDLILRSDRPQRRW